jgi:gliding motility-associated-like protein
MSSHNLQLTSQEIVRYSNIDCVREELSTSRVVWSAEVALDPNEYADQAGYYIVWERCCRNETIKNIVNPSATGMKYVLEIPPLMKNGQVFVNSSPVLFRPLSDYACINQLYYIEFTGTDPDGDSLVYSLTTPYNSSAAVALPNPTPKPHGNVAFASGYSESNMIPGSPSLAISNKGLLTVTPAETGLYVFSVLVQEFRSGQKIGQTRRDFQMLVVDGCEPPDPPVVDIDVPDNPFFNPETDILSYTVVDAKCFNFLVSNISDGETISFRAEGVNFDDKIEVFSQPDSTVENSSQIVVEVCIPDCPPIRDEPFILDLIAGDDACPLPQLDTLRLTLDIQPPANVFPTTTSTNKTLIINEDEFYSEVITATDPDNHEIEMSLFVEGLENPGSQGFSLQVTNSSPGNAEATFSWNTACEVFDFSSNQQFNVGIIIDDMDECSLPNPDTLFIDAQVVLPPNTDPVVSTSAIIPNQIDLGSILNFDVTVSDSDNDEVSLRLIGGNFSPDFYGIDFTPVSGNTSATSTFSWDLVCDPGAFSDGQLFELIFVGDDDDKCKTKNYDTLRTIVQVNYPANTKPEFESIDRNQVLRVNEKNRIEIEAFDPDSDEITLDFAEGIRQPASNSLSFEPVTGIGRVSSFLEWQPECSLLRFGETSTFQDVVFQVTDNACPISNIDTLKITFEIIDDQERQKEFLPPNVFTPNGDGFNDTFTLSGNLNREQNLPADNCDNQFEYIVINNRAGNTVFRTKNRDFIWTGGQFPSGVYFYLIKYSNTEFKGYIHLLR